MIHTTVEPDEEPVTLQNAKDHLHIDDENSDDVITAFIVTAREYVESYTCRPIITQTRTYYGTDLDGLIELAPNLVAIKSIEYVDDDGAQQTLASAEYTADTKALVGYVCPAYDKEWPTVRSQINSVEIKFTCGYGDIDEVPQQIKQAMYLLVGDMFELREETVVGTITKPTGAVASLLNNFRVKL